VSVAERVADPLAKQTLAGWRNTTVHQLEDGPFATPVHAVRKDLEFDERLAVEYESTAAATLYRAVGLKGAPGEETALQLKGPQVVN